MFEKKGRCSFAAGGMKYDDQGLFHLYGCVFKVSLSRTSPDRHRHVAEQDCRICSLRSGYPPRLLSFPELSQYDGKTGTKRGQICNFILRSRAGKPVEDKQYLVHLMRIGRKGCHFVMD
jgi:hypothetical protein